MAAFIDPERLALALGGFAVIALFAVIAVSLMGRRAPARRLETVIGARSAGRDGRAGQRDERQGRRKQVDATLKELAERQQATAKKHGRADLRAQMRQAGIGWSRALYVAICVGAGAVVFALGVVGLGLGPLPSAGFAVAGGALLPYGYVGRKRAKRFKAFLAELPDALDVIVRGVRSGLPLNDCLRGIAEDGREPVRGEFKLLVEDMAIGLPLDEAISRMVARTPILEVTLFGIILSIQNKAGGNLSEAIGNLSRVLRDRKKMQGKIRALSAEATSSAAIIGALPILVLGLLYLSAPDYIALLFNTQVGNLALAAGGVWMTIGIFVMRGMIKIDI